MLAISMRKSNRLLLCFLRHVLLAYVSASQIVGAHPWWVQCDAKGVPMTPGNKYTYAIFIDIREIFSHPIRGLRRI